MEIINRPVEDDDEHDVEEDDIDELSKNSGPIAGIKSS
jgi:hypothetical protein